MKKIHTEIVTYLVPTSAYRRAHHIGRIPKLVLSLIDNRDKIANVERCANLKISRRSSINLISRCVCPLLGSERRVLEMHVPACVLLHHADRVENSNKRSNEGLDSFAKYVVVTCC